MDGRTGHVPVEGLRARAFTVPTDAPESDGTHAWNATTLLLVEALGGGRRGMGWSYTHAAAARVVDDTLAAVVTGLDALSPRAAWEAMRRSVRNLGRQGLAASALSAVDVALWDLKARLHDVALATLWGPVREAVPVYGSGGFTSYDPDRLCGQLADWVARGIPRVKMKVGRDPAADPGRVAAARRAIGPDAELFVDANGAYRRKEALRQAERFADQRVTWFEEPVSSDDLEGLRLLRDRVPAGMEVAAGEYGWGLPYFRRMLDAGAVDTLQADATRCLGFTGFLQVAALCEARSLPLSAHTAPALHLHVGCAAPSLAHVEYFHDHVRIGRLFFEGWPEPVDGALVLDRTRPGLGLAFREADAEPYRVA